MNVLSKFVSLLNFGTLSNATPLPEGWYESLAEATNVADASGKPVLVKVHADWCGYCKNFDEEVAYVPLLSNYLKRYVCARVRENSAEGRKLKKEHKVAAYPTFVVYRNGEFVGKVRGYKNAPSFVDALKAFDSDSV